MEKLDLTDLDCMNNDSEEESEDEYTTRNNTNFENFT